jgi:hypothetical protein
VDSHKVLKVLKDLEVLQEEVGLRELKGQEVQEQVKVLKVLKVVQGLQTSDSRKISDQLKPPFQKLKKLEESLSCGMMILIIIQKLI